MANINGYFQIVRNEKGMSMRLYPPAEGGKAINPDEVMQYLEDNHIENVDVVSLNKGIQEATDKIKEVVLTLNRGYAINELMHLEYIDNNMKAIARFYPASRDGQDLSKNEILSDLEYAGVKYGIDESIIDAFLKERQYCKDYVIATGKAVREGENASIEYYFNTDRKIKPRRNEDGSVDFHQLDNISHIHKGDVLARLTPADKGDSGIDVMGKEVMPRKVEHLKLKYGKNISISEDELTIISDVDGHAVLEGAKVFVSNTYEVPANVDNATGDIKYEGNVVVKGNVRTNFKITASGDVEVFGFVEGAQIVSGGQIILHHGIQGMNKGMLVAKGNIVAKFIESSRVHSDGYIEAEAIIQSHVAAKEEVNVSGAKGNIIGGHVRSASKISAKVIGSDMGINTVVEVGVDPAVQDRMLVLRNSITDKNKECEKLTKLVEMFKEKSAQGKLDKEKVELYMKLLKELSSIQDEIKKEQEEMGKISEAFRENDNATISVNQEIHPGVKMIIAGEIKLVNEKIRHCKFMKKENQIKALMY